jgi:ABC-type antimicrobial peptide transport system permease subunit
MMGGLWTQMSEISFPLKDLTRRKFQTGLTILGLTLCTATTLFLVVFGTNLGFEIVFIAIRGRLTIGFLNVLSRFIFIVSLLNILAGSLFTSFFVYMAMSERVRDIGVMKAAGCLSGSIFGYFITELSILVFISCTAGAIIGILVYFTCINLLNFSGFSLSQVLNLWTILFIFLVLILASHIFGALPIIKATKVKPAEALSPLYSLGTTFKMGKRAPSKLGFTLKVAYRGLVRRKSATLHVIICLAVVFTLTTATIAGGIVANQTTVNYVERAIGKDVVFVGHPDLTSQYENLLSQFFEAREIEPLNYTDPDYLISEPFVSKLANISGVLKVDPRLILEASVLEIPGIIPNPNDPNEALVIGDSRSSDAFILGVEPKQVVNEWLIVGRVLNETDRYSTIIGDSLALAMFDIPQKQEIKMFEEFFKIVGVCLDPLNNGKVVYMPLEILSKKLRQSNYNLVFLKIDSSKRSQFLAEIGDKISEKNLVLLELNDILYRHVSFLNNIWSFVTFLPLFSLATATLCLLSYLMLSITGQQREFSIMRALGAKPRTIVKIILIEGLLVTLVGSAIGISVGFFVTFTFLIPEPVVSWYTLVSVTGWLLLALILLCLSSLYPALKVIKKPITNIISQP